MKRLLVCAMTIVLTLGILPVDAAKAAKKAPLSFPAITQSVADTTFVIFDTETTGFSAKYDRIVEIGAVKIRNGKVIDEGTWLINPQRSIPARASSVHGITEDMVEGQPTFEDVYPEFKAFIKDAVLVAHNARFDISMMRAELQGAGIELPTNQVIDSLRLFRNWFPETKSHQLSALAAHLNIKGDKFHRATADSLYAGLILFKGIEQKKDVDTLGELLADAGGPMLFY